MSNEIDRLDEIQAEVQQILEERISTLSEKIRAVHEVSRRLLEVEVELERQAQLHQELNDELALATDNLEKSIADNEAIEDQIDT